MLTGPAKCLTVKAVSSKCLAPGIITILDMNCHRTVHSSLVNCMASRRRSDLPSTTSRKLKNVAFVKRWNQENSAIFGPKLKISKKTLKKRAELAGVDIDNPDNGEAVIIETQFAPVVEAPAPEDGVQPTEIKSSKKSSKPKTTSPKSGSTSSPQTPLTNLSELDGVLRFPLFRPNTEALGQSMTASILTTEIPILHNVKLPRVTRVLDQTKSEQSQFVLNRWIQGEIARLGKEGFGAAQRKRLRVASGLHGCLEQFLMGTPEHLLNLEEDILPYWSSMQGALQAVEDVFGVEVKVEHEHLKYTGTADCIAKYKGELCVIDWKTSSKPKPSLGDLFDYPMQVAAYMGALQFNRLDQVTANEQINNLLIVVGYEDGSPAHAHFIPRRRVLQYWGEWTRRLHQYWVTTLSQQRYESWGII